MFKNKQKKKIIKSYQTESTARKKFKSLSDSKNVLFPIRYENAEKVKYEIGILTDQEMYQLPLFQVDDIGGGDGTGIGLERRADGEILEIEIGVFHCWVSACSSLSFGRSCALTTICAEMASLRPRTSS